MTIYHNPRCRKSRETLALIRETGTEPTIIEYLKTPPAPKELNKLLQLLSISPEQLVRKNEKVYKESFKGKILTHQEWLETLSANPVLIERPIVVHNDKAVIGRPPENVKELL